MAVDPCILTHFNAHASQIKALGDLQPAEPHLLPVDLELVWWTAPPGTLFPSRPTKLGIATSRPVGTSAAFRRYNAAEEKQFPSGASEGPCSGKATFGPTLCQEASVCLARVISLPHGECARPKQYRYAD
jgi:hypothetical protein